MKHAFKLKKWLMGCVLISSVFSVCSPAFSGDSWAIQAPMSVARYEHAVGVLNGRLYVVGGKAGNDSALNGVEAYDPLTDTWMTRAPLTSDRHGHAVGVLNGVLYAVGGRDRFGNARNTLDAYDPVTNTWATKAPMIAGGYAYHAVGVLNGKLYAVGGISSTGGSSASVTAYDPGTNTWETKASLPAPRHNLAVGVVNGMLYAIGGHNNAGNNAAITATVQRYNPADDAWTIVAPMPTARAQLAVGVANGILYAIGGLGTSGNVLNTVEAYNPVANTWETRPAMPTARYRLAAGAVGPVLYAVGGDVSSCCYGIVSTLEAHTSPPTPTNHPPTAMAGPSQRIYVGQSVALDGRGSHDDNTVAGLLQYAWSFASKPAGSSAVLANPGTVSPYFVADQIGTYVIQLVVTDQGGLSSVAAHVTIQVADDYWVYRAPMSSVRYSHAVGVLKGMLYAVGGNNANNDTFFSTVEAYDPLTNSWTTKTSMSLGRLGLAVGEVGGKLYAVGGAHRYGSTHLVEAYDPEINTWTTRSPLISNATTYHAIGVLGDMLYSVGGLDRLTGASSAAVAAYSPNTDSWEMKPSMSTPRYQHAVGVVNGKLYAVGGYNNTASGFHNIVVSAVEEFDPLTNSWVTKAPMPTARWGLSVGVVGGVLYAVGGYNNINGPLLDIVEAYDPVTDTWTTVASMLTPRYDFGVGVVGTKLYAVGGNASSCCYTMLNSVEEYTPGTKPANMPTNLPPVANAGPDQTVHASEVVYLDGTGSTDDQTPVALLDYAWSLTSPPGSSAMLVGANTATPGFTPDVVGSFVVQLVVTDADGLPSAPATVTITSANASPVADAGNNQTVIVGRTATLSGSGSDADVDVLTYAWSFISRPTGSTTALFNPTTATPSFVADVPGQYVVELVVSDMFGLSAPDQVTITAITLADYVIPIIGDIRGIVAGMNPGDFDAPGHKNALLNFIDQAAARMLAGDVVGVRDKLNQGIIRTDGYPLRGALDSNGTGKDWIIEATDQHLLYPLYLQALNALP